jgi:lauroyl/myristoyl acyltransferase
MKLQNLINGVFGIGTALIISRIFPRKFGHWVAGNIATLLVNRKSLQFVPALRSNQWVVSRQALSESDLDHRVKVVFKNTAKCLFDFYHFLNRPDEIIKRVTIHPEVNRYFDPITRCNAVFVAAHLSNFDFLGQALGTLGYTFQILSYPDPGGGYQWQNKLRMKTGHIITPTSISSLRQARNRLREGGNVLTGLDRPVDGLKYRPMFFGHPASLPVAYTHLAVQAGVPVVVVSAITKPDGDYYLYASDPIQMVSQNDPYRESIRNTEAVLEVAEEIISKYPEQWSMFYPVWPQFVH